MEGVDKEKVQRIVYEMSKGSKYFQNEERKEALMNQKIEHMRDRSAKLSFSDLSNYQKVCNYLLLFARNECSLLSILGYIIDDTGSGIFSFLFF